MELSIPASPSRLAGLRRAARASLGEVQDEVADDVVLALNEVATNAVLHGSGRIDIYVTLDSEALRIAVVDDGRRTPDRWPRLGATPPLGGRGLRIVDALASTWGNNFDPVGRTRVWAEMVR